MRLLHVKQARSVWLFDLLDLNPRGKDILEDAIEWIKGAYNFAIAPDLDKAIPPPGEQGYIPSAGLVFQRGRFQAREDLFVEIIALTIYNDGIVVDTTSSTQEADRFAGDLLSSVAKEFGLAYEPDMVRKRMYVSTLIVRSDISLSAVYPGLAAFAERISTAQGNGIASEFQLATVGFWSEPNSNGIHKTFTVSPQIGKSLSEHRYFSEAPLKTEDHYRLLEELEAALATPIRKN